MLRKILPLTATAAMAVAALSGCAATQPSMLDYLNGTWSCTGTDRQGVFMVKDFTATLTDDTFALESSDERTAEIFDGMGLSAPLAVNAVDDLTTLGDIAIRLPETKPEDGTTISMPYGTVENGMNREIELVATVESSTVSIVLTNTKTGVVYSDSGTCTKQ